MYLLYLRYKAVLIRYKKILMFVFVANVTYLIGILIIAISFLIMGREPNWLFGWYTIVSSCIFIPLATVFNQMMLTDIQKKILCMHFRTGYKRCDDLIDIIVKAARKKESILKFTYKGLETSAVYLNTVIDEPIIDPATINGIHLTPLIKYPMRKSDGENWLYLREFLVSYTDSPTDYIELEKTFIDHLS